jgi:hypothetical protein
MRRQGLRTATETRSAHPLEQKSGGLCLDIWNPLLCCDDCPCDEIMQCASPFIEQHDHHLAPYRAGAHRDPSLPGLARVNLKGGSRCGSLPGGGNPPKCGPVCLGRGEPSLARRTARQQHWLGQKGVTIVSPDLPTQTNRATVWRVSAFPLSVKRRGGDRSDACCRAGQGG